MEEKQRSNFGPSALQPLLTPAASTSDISNLSQGVDVTTLGLDFSKKYLSHSFESPWQETSRSHVKPYESETITPPAQPVTIETQLKTLTELELFYLFYSQSKTILQELSARELGERNWKYHKELQVWLTKADGLEPTPVGFGCEDGNYKIFDPARWEYVNKQFRLYYNSLANL